MIALTFFSIGFSINIVGNIRRFNFLDQPPPSWEKVIGKNLKLPTYAERLTPVFLRGYDTNVGAIYVFICGEQYLNFLLSCTNLQNKPVPNVRLTSWNELKDILFELCPDEKMEEIKLKHPSWLALMDAGKDKPYYTFSIDYIPTDDSIKAVKPFSSVIKSSDLMNSYEKVLKDGRYNGKARISYRRLPEDNVYFVILLMGPYTWI